MLTREQIEALKIIQDADESCFNETCYDLRLGDEYVLLDGDGETRICKFSDKGANAMLGIRIAPFGCILLSTKECLRMPEGVYGRWGFDLCCQS